MSFFNSYRISLSIIFVLWSIMFYAFFFHSPVLSQDMFLLISYAVTVVYFVIAFFLKDTPFSHIDLMGTMPYFNIVLFSFMLTMSFLMKGFGLLDLMLSSFFYKKNNSQIKGS